MNFKKNIFLIYYLPVVIWAVIILVVSSLPHPYITKPSWTKYDKAAHFIEYAVFGFPLARALWHENNKNVTLFIVSLSLLIAGAFAALDEIHQKYIPGRIGSLGDFIANISGIVIAHLVYFRYYFWNKIKGK